MSDDTPTEITVQLDAVGMPEAECPVCGQPFDADEWPLTAHGQTPDGGIGVHTCPTDGCEGSATVSY